jgi:hypothetical protein
MEEELERLIDTYGLRRVLEALANACADKAVSQATYARRWMASSVAIEWCVALAPT